MQILSVFVAFGLKRNVLDLLFMVSISTKINFPFGQSRSVGAWTSEDQTQSQEISKSYEYAEGSRQLQTFSSGKIENIVSHRAKVIICLS